MSVSASALLARPPLPLDAVAGAAEAARRRLLRFVQVCYAGYQTAPERSHHVLLIEHLEAVERGNIKRLMVEMPPRHGKSLLVSIHFPAWFIARQPRRRIIAASYAAELAYTFSRQARNLFEHPLWPFPRVQLAADARGVEHWQTSDGGGYVAAGVGGSITGHGADLLVIDDPVRNREDADSQTVRDSQWEWYTCFHPDTEVLTAEGWKSVGEVIPGDLAATMNPNDRWMTYSQVSDVQAYPFAGDMVTLNQRLGAAFAVTPNHIVWASMPESSVLRPYRADLLPRFCGLPQWCVWEGNAPPPTIIFDGQRHYEFKIDDWMEFVGWYLAEGNTAGRYDVRLSQTGQDGQTQIRDLLGRLGIHAYEPGGRAFEFRSKAIHAYLAPLGKALDKHMPKEVKAYPPELLRRLLLGLVRGDGTWLDEKQHRGHFVTGSKRLADDVCEVAIKAGYRPTMVVQSSVLSGNPAYHIHLCRKSTDTRLDARERGGRGHGTSRVEYHGMVYCVTVPPYHTVLTRCHGRVVWMGQSTARTRLQPNAAIVLCQTRWHEDDLAGRLLRAEKQGGEPWKVLRLPAIAEQDDPLDRAPGAALWPQWFGEAALATIRQTIGSRNWYALYQQRPMADEGALFKRQWFRTVEAMPPGLRWVRYWDLAASTRASGDYTCGCKAAFGSDGTLYIADVARGRWEWPEALAIVRGMADLDGRGVVIGIEGIGVQRGFRQLLMREPTLRNVAIVDVPVLGDKQLRASPWQARAEAGKVALALAPWNAAFLDEVCSFPLGEHDDMVDACSGAVQMLARATSPQTLSVGIR